MEENAIHSQYRANDPWEPLDEDKARSPFDRFADVFTKPVQAFASLTTSKNRGAIIWWGIAIGILVVSILAIVLASSPDFIDQAFAQQKQMVESRYENGKISQQEYDSTLETFEQTSQQGVYLLNELVVSIPGFIIAWLCIALMVFVIAKVLERRDETEVIFKTAWSVVMIAVLIPSLERIVTIGLIMASGNIEADVSLKTLIVTENLFFKALLGFFNPFTWWWIFATGTGIAAVANTDKKRAILVWGSVWLCITLLGGLGMQIALIMFS